MLIFASGVSDSKEINDSEFKREEELLEQTVKQYQNATIAYFSTCSIYDDSTNKSSYVRHKLKMEGRLKQHDGFYIFRLPQVVGETQSPTLAREFFQSIVAGKKIKIYKNSTRNLIYVDDVLSLWGSGGALREFLYVDDLAEACVKLMTVPKAEYEQCIPLRNSHVNIGTGSDVTIKELVNLLVDIIGYKGDIQWDTSKPDGTPRKLLDVSRIAGLGWKASIELDDGLDMAYRSYLASLT